MMLTINSEQLEVFSSNCLAKFRLRAIDHVWRCWPRESTALGAERVQNRIDKVIEEAMSRGLRGQKDVVVYIDLAFLLGSDSWVPANVPWVNEIFAEPKLSPPTKLRVVWQRATEALRQSGTV